MFCMKCGKELPDDARFCLSCGAEMPARKDTAEMAEQSGASPVTQERPSVPEVEAAETPAAKPATRKKQIRIILVAVLALAVCAAVALAIVMKPAKGQLGELHDLSAYTAGVNLLYHNGSKTVCYMESDYDNKDISFIRRTLREAELQEVKGRKAEDLIQRVSSSERIKISLESSGFTKFELTVSSEGDVIVSGKDNEFGRGLCYQGGQEIFDTLRSYLPTGSEIDLGDIFPEGDTGVMIVTYQGKNIETDGAYLSDEEIVAACIEAIRNKSVKLAPGNNISFDGEIVTIQFSTSGAGILDFWIDSRGEGRLEMNGWIYYLSDVDTLLGPMERAMREFA